MKIMNRNINVFLLFCVTLFTFFITDTNCFGKDYKKIVLIPPFENLSQEKSMSQIEIATSKDPNNPKRYFTVDRYTEIPRAILEDMLIVQGIEVVERQRLDQMLLEHEFIRLSGLVDTENAIKIGKLLGANSIIMGTIVNIHTIDKSFSGYAIKTEVKKVRCSIRIRLIDIESGKIKYSKIVKGSVSFMKSEYGGLSDSDVAYSVIEATLEKLPEDEGFIQFFNKK